MERPARYTIKTTPRQARERHNEQVVRQLRFATLRLLGEELAEFECAAVACEKAYRVIVLEEKLVVEEGQIRPLEPDRFFF